MAHPDPTPPAPGSAARLRVAVLFGGTSAEHDVSVASGRQVVSAIDRDRHEILPVFIERDGSWHVGREPAEVSLAARADGSGPRRPVERDRAAATRLRVDELVARGVDVVLLALHGAGGEDGCVQGLLELAGLPYTGSGVLASALAMDKVKSKELYLQHGIPVARHAVLLRRTLAGADEAARSRLLDDAAAAVGLPCIVKPVRGGSSFGTHRVLERSALDAAAADALAEDARALVEELVTGTEVTCGVLGGGPHEEAQALPVTEIAPVGSDFFDFRAKYTKGACDEITPARLPEAVNARVQQLALTAHAALGCEGLSRTDFIVRDGVPVALETNTLPGMTGTSLLPQAAAVAGLSFPRLLDRLIASALLRARAEGP